MRARESKIPAPKPNTSDIGKSKTLRWPWWKGFKKEQPLSIEKPKVVVLGGPLYNGTNSLGPEHARQIQTSSDHAIMMRDGFEI